MSAEDASDDNDDVGRPVMTMAQHPANVDTTIEGFGTLTMHSVGR